MTGRTITALLGGADAVIEQATFVAKAEWVVRFQPVLTDVAVANVPPLMKILTVPNIVPTHARRRGNHSVQASVFGSISKFPGPFSLSRAGAAVAR
ncbi:hypothetical protein ABIB82_000364 [Bradyrhizobium sp. i1.8.4]|uniref:hypothetical protein n=1 Tax=unclassified Bradyrhizobium TaxID=2631580 RepID=UPI003D1912ED